MNDSVSQQETQRRLDHFQRRFGKPTLYLAYHAALPVVLSADLVHLLRINFFLDPPDVLDYEAEANLLLSFLCSEVDDGLYEIDHHIRNLLLEGLVNKYGWGRVGEVATLLWHYSKRYSPWRNRIELERTQQLTVLSFLDPQKAEQWLGKAEENPVISGEREWFVAVRGEMKRHAKLSKEIAQQMAEEGLEHEVSESDEAEYPQYMKELVSQIKKGNCILFLGAGIHAPPPQSSPYIYPEEERPLIGMDLAEVLASACDYRRKFSEESQLDLQRISLFFEQTPGLGRSKLVDDLTRHLQIGKKPSPLLSMLAQMPFRIFITTNYDGMLESALRKSDKDPMIFIYNPNPNELTQDMAVDPTAERPLIFKMHGDLHRPESIVITDEDYINFVQRMSDRDALHPVPQTVRFRMKTWPTLFVGYSLRDYNLRLIFRTLRWRIDPANYPRSFFVDRNPDQLILQTYQDERRFITCITEDIWTFLPFLFEEVTRKEYQHD